MKLRVLAVAAAALVLPFSVVACGDDSTGDLSVNEISSELQKGGINKEQADCIAEALKKADFTKKELENLDSMDISTGKGKEYVDAASKCLLGE